MAPFLVIVVTLCRLTGTHGITTVSEEVSVEVGATVSIPCLYKPSHKNLVKYLCKGGVWLSCDKIITTNSKSSFPEGQYTISDDPDQGVFTVSIISQEEGTQTYWCAVEMGFSKLDEKTQFKLFVSKGKSSLYVDQQEITGFAGDSINISFDSKTHGKRGWCILGHCKEPQDGFIEGSHYSIDASKQGVFVVTMKDLDMESSGWYIFFQGKLNMPIHLTVAVNSKTMNTRKFKSVASKGIKKNILVKQTLKLNQIVSSLIKVSSETDVVYSSVMPVHSTAAQNKPTGDMNLKVNPLLVIHLIHAFIY
uniref:Immunoglobulin domain-containing protein n=1 Tax=Gadus morhua TaxID=8049 RepID=A0A8C5CUE0_GADMO